MLAEKEESVMGVRKSNHIHKTVEIEREDLVAIHNNAVAIISKLAESIEAGKGLTAEEVKELYSRAYPVLDIAQGLVVNNGGFAFCVEISR